jgi:eukaryotic-like serine/threonine-protein kinase
MELVEGPTLAERVARGPIPPEEALPIARQIAQALEAAHEKNIIHRDLKPANVKITPEGNVKVLDFGLAKALEENPAVTNGANSPTVSAMPTRAGIILGTAAYMSPEQARGVAVDRRTDIWSFGVVMFEMLSGRPAFQGETTSDTLASVLKLDPDWSALPASTPSSIDRLLHRCLTKNSKQRLQAIGDARIEIENALAAPLRPQASTAAPGATAPVVGTSRLLRPSTWVLVAVLLCLSLLAGMWFQTRPVAPQFLWSGDRLGGANIAFGPRISPDGHTIAFQAMVDTLTQVAVMNVDSGNWTLLTRDRSRGYVSEIGWSHDGSKLYFDRVLSQPQGIYSVSSLGGEEHLVLEAAETPETLPDGSLLVARIDSDRRARVYHYWPDSGRIQSLDAWPLKLDSLPMRVSPDGRFVVFFGTVKEARPGGAPHLYALNITTGSMRQLAPQSPIRLPSFLFPLAVTPDNRSVLLDLPTGDLHQIVAVPISGSGPVQPLATLTNPPWFIDVGSDGSLYIDQIDRPQEVLRFPLSGGTPEVIGGSEISWNVQPVEFADGRFLLYTVVSGRPRLLIGRPGGNFSPLVDTAEPTAPPATLLANDQVAFIAGKEPDQSIVIGSAGEGRIVRRLQGVSGNDITCLAASPEGRTIYYVASGSVWSVPAAGGTVHRICPGDGVAVDPNGKDLIVQLNETPWVRLVRVPLPDGPQKDIRIQGDTALNYIPIGGKAVREDGEILVGIAPKDSYFFGVAILDPTTGELTKVPVNYTGDKIMANWASDGRHVIAIGLELKGNLWRFHPLPRSN